MTSLQKAALTVQGNDVHISVPLAKVDKDNRTVSGFATLDNVDTQGDVVLAEASAKAFARARGNLREMHQPIAVGKVIDFREDEYYDPETEQFYRGIFVTARVSKGAEDTWHKVLDGTLSGFSIGGEIIDASNEFVKESNKNVRFIKDYELVELSLVDNPANQMSNIISIQKSADGSVKSITGMAVETKIENVFFCEEDAVIQALDSETADCPNCGKKMELAGWFENTGNRAEKVREVMAKFLAVDETGDSEGGVDMAKKEDTPTDETVETGHEAGDPTEVPTPVDGAEVQPEEVDETAGTDDEVQKSETVEEVHDDETEISKKIDELKEVFVDSISKVNESHESTKEQIATLEKKVGQLDELATKVSELGTQLSSYGERLETTKNRLAELETTLEKFNSAEALKKSGELEDSKGTVQKDRSAWNGAFSLNNMLK